MFKTRIRTKWFKVKINFYAIPEISMDFKNLPESSYSEKLGSPRWNPIRTFYTIIFYFGSTRLSKNKQSFLLYPIMSQGEIELCSSESFSNFK